VAFVLVLHNPNGRVQELANRRGECSMKRWIDDHVFHGKGDLPLSKVMDDKRFKPEVVKRGVDAAVQIQLAIRKGKRLYDAAKEINLFDDAEVMAFLIACWKHGNSLEILSNKYQRELKERAEET
jgi:hypothetical protein